MRARWSIGIAGALAAMASALALPCVANAAENRGAGAAATPLKSFATPYYFLKTVPATTVCYIANVGAKPVSITNFGIRTTTSDPQYAFTDCPDPKSFRLGPGKSCSVTVRQIGAVLACTARSDNVASLRGSMEFSHADGTVAAAIETAVGCSALSSGDDYESIASAPMFGSPSQTRGFCIFWNAGTIASKIKNVLLATSTGVHYFIKDSQCVDRTGKAVSPGVIRPGGSCVYAATIEALDLRCQAQVTQKADVRASLIIDDGNSATYANQQPVE